MVGHVQRRVSGGQSMSFSLRFAGRMACGVTHLQFGVTMVSAAGTPIPGQMPSGPFVPPERNLVQPGQLVSGFIDWTPDAGDDRRVTSVRFSIGDALQNWSISVIDDGSRPAPTSGNQSWSSGRLQSVSDPGTLASLDAELSVTTPVATDAIVHGQVRISNATDVPVSLRPCPTTSVDLRTAVGKAVTSLGATGLLDCTDLPPTLAPGADVTIPIAVEGTGPVDDGALTWALMDRSAVAVVATGYLGSS